MRRSLIAVVLAAAAVVCCGAVLDKETKERLTAVAASFAAVTAALSASNTALSLTIAAVSSTLLAGAGVVIRDEWVRQRGQSWWEGDAQHFNDEEFREHFRVCKATFTYLVERLRPLIQKQDTRLRKAKPAELLVALTLRKLATGDTFQSIAIAFGLHRSSVQYFFSRTVHALVTLQADFVFLPKSVEEVEALAVGAQRLGARWGGWPGAALQADGCYIGVPFGQRRYGHSDMRCRKGFMAHNCLFVVDYQTRCRAVVAGRHGTTGDARIWRESRVGSAAIEGTLLFGAAFSLPTGERIAYHVLGDGIYPACQLMHKAPSDIGGNDEVVWHAYCQSVTRQPVEHFNAHLKGRWRTLQHTADYDVSFVPYVVIACCILHNICLDHAEEFDERLVPVEKKKQTASQGESDSEESDGEHPDQDAVPVDALPIREAVLAMRKHLWKLCPPDIKRQGVRNWRKSILKG